MPRLERIREAWQSPPDAEYFERRSREGWTLAAIEWKRELQPGAVQTPESEIPYEVPYGLRIAGDCLHLEEDPVERQVLLQILEAIVQDHRLSQASGLLNDRGFKTRVGGQWTPGAVFDLLPRLVEAGPGLLSSQEWVQRRSRLMQLL